MKEKKYADRKNDKPDLKPAAQAFARDPGVPWDYRGAGQYSGLYYRGIGKPLGISKRDRRRIRAAAVHGDRGIKDFGEKRADPA